MQEASSRALCAAGAVGSSDFAVSSAMGAAAVSVSSPSACDWTLVTLADIAGLGGAASCAAALLCGAFGSSDFAVSSVMRAAAVSVSFPSACDRSPATLADVAGLGGAAGEGFIPALTPREPKKSMETKTEEGATIEMGRARSTIRRDSDAQAVLRERARVCGDVLCTLGGGRITCACVLSTERYALDHR